ncbi:hypothetical protein BJ508DRAFT_363997 [Ascobolus immersus RN42]|uniref:Uncharacterized protein n=1 Tax=Ascobolus immersus RN42 TaxID=1160509 RepID=A0A3N4HYP6_ASCIM|nr:hypothetical protein BJ508DRAFT_363997 [Ascobolus immersus RN42]
MMDGIKIFSDHDVAAGENGEGQKAGKTIRPSKLRRKATRAALREVLGENGGGSVNNEVEKSGEKVKEGGEGYDCKDGVKVVKDEGCSAEDKKGKAKEPLVRDITDQLRNAGNGDLAAELAVDKMLNPVLRAVRARHDEQGGVKGEKEDEKQSYVDAAEEVIGDFLKRGEKKKGAAPKKTPEPSIGPVLNHANLESTPLVMTLLQDPAGRETLANFLKGHTGITLSEARATVADLVKAQEPAPTTEPKTVKLEDEIDEDDLPLVRKYIPKAKDTPTIAPKATSPPPVPARPASRTPLEAPKIGGRRRALKAKKSTATLWPPAPEVSPKPDPNELIRIKYLDQLTSKVTIFFTPRCTIQANLAAGKALPFQQKGWVCDGMKVVGHDLEAARVAAREEFGDEAVDAGEKGSVEERKVEGIARFNELLRGLPEEALRAALEAAGSQEQESSGSCSPLSEPPSDMDLDDEEGFVAGVKASLEEVVENTAAVKSRSVAEAAEKSRVEGGQAREAALVKARVEAKVAEKLKEAEEAAKLAAEDTAADTARRNNAAKLMSRFSHLIQNPEKFVAAVSAPTENLGLIINEQTTSASGSGTKDSPILLSDDIAPPITLHPTNPFIDPRPAPPPPPPRSTRSAPSPLTTPLPNPDSLLSSRPVKRTRYTAADIEMLLDVLSGRQAVDWDDLEAKFVVGALSEREEKVWGVRGLRIVVGSRRSELRGVLEGEGFVEGGEVKVVEIEKEDF